MIPEFSIASVKRLLLGFVHAVQINGHQTVR